MWFFEKFKHYLDWNHIKDYHAHFNSVWVNQMFEHEYNPVHVHQGSLYTGLSSVMILKLPLKLKPRFNEPWIVLNQFWKKIQVNGLGNLSFKLTYSRMSMVPKILVKILHIFKLLTKALGPWLYFKEEKREAQASSPKQQASSSRPQATSSKI